MHVFPDYAHENNAHMRISEIMHDTGTFISDHKLIIGLCIASATCGLMLNKYMQDDEYDQRLSDLNHVSGTVFKDVPLICLNETEPHPSTVFIFAHGIDTRATAAITQANNYIKSGIINSTCYTFNFHDKIKNLNFGQDRDCHMLASVYAKVHQKHPHANIVFVGLSRGASAIVNTIAHYTELDWSPVKAVILESPFEHVESLAHHMIYSYAFFVPYGKNIFYNLLKKITAYNPEGMQAIEMIKQFPHTIPLFVGYSKADKTVSPQGTEQFITNIQSTGRQIASWAAASGRHSTLTTQPAYAAAVQDFYKDIYN